MRRVLVIGGGLAGATAAFAAREAGASVVLVARAPGATALCGGILEVAQDSLGRALPAREAAEGLAARSPTHPYALLRGRLAELPAALDLVRVKLAPLLVEIPAMFPTVLGGLRAAALAQASHAAGALRPGCRFAVGWCPRQPALLDGPAVAAALREAGVLAEPCDLDWLDREDHLALTAFELARLLDRPEEARRLGEALARARPAADAWLLPPVIGLERAEEALKVASDLAGLPCAELVAATPSVPGARLQRALDRALERAGVELRCGEVARLEEGRAQLGGELGPSDLSFDQAVFATGRFIGGGVRRAPVFAEPLLGLPIWDGATRLLEQPVDTLLGEGPGAPAAAFRAGIHVDGELRPLDDRGEPIPWLHAAGAVIGGGDAAVDGAGLGLAAFTGFLAGRLAAGVAG
ncbi:MAG: FAD-binding protein [Myxococcales bacterium]